MADYSVSAALEAARSAANAAAASVAAARDAATAGNVGLADQLLSQSRVQGQQAQALVQTSVAAAHGDVVSQQQLAAHGFGAIPWWAKLGGLAALGYGGYRLFRGRRGGRRGGR